MAEVHGKNALMYGDGNVLHTYFRTISLSKSVSNPENTTIGSDVRTRQTGGILDGDISGDGVYSDASGEIDEYLESILGVDDTIYTVFPGPSSTVGDYAWCMAAINSEYASETVFDDVVSFDFAAQGKGGLHLCKALVPPAAKTSTADGTTLNNGGSTANGGVAYLQVFADDTLTSLDVIIEHSSTGAFAGEESTIATFTQVTGSPAAEKIEISGTIEQYVRASWTISGTSVSFLVALHRRYSA